MEAVEPTTPKKLSTSRPRIPGSSSLPPIEPADDYPDPTLTRRNSIPLTLESIPDEPPAELGSDRLPADRPSASRTPAAGSPRPKTEPSTPAASRPAPSRGSSTFFGRLAGLTGLKGGGCESTQLDHCRAPRRSGRRGRGQATHREASSAGRGRQGPQSRDPGVRPFRDHPRSSSPLLAAQVCPPQPGNHDSPIGLPRPGRNDRLKMTACIAPINKTC